MTEAGSDQGGDLFSKLRHAVRSGGGVQTFHLADGRVKLPGDALLEMSLSRAAWLQAHDVGPGDAVAVLGPNHPQWAAWAFATWAVGAVLVPIGYPLRVRDPASFADRTRALLRTATSRMVLAHPRFLDALPEAVSWEQPDPVHPASLDPVPSADPAVLQFTSGSTAHPKGVQLSHRAIGASIRALQSARATQPGDRLAAWLPFFHDYGLFSYLVLPVVSALEVHTLPTERFARDPGLWFQLLSEERASVTGGPSSSWGTALRLAVRNPADLDLSPLRLGYVAAETIDPAVIDGLRDIARKLSLRPEAIGGGYGLAEATLGVTQMVVGELARIERVDLRTLAERERAVPAGRGPAKRIVSCGRPLPGMEVRIGSPDDPMADGEVGEVLVRGPSLMTGYVGDGAGDPIEDGWLHTGDRGYLREGELYVTGRSKELVIVGGNNYAPEDIEWAAARVAGVRPGRVVAFSYQGDGRESVVVVAERRGDPDPRLGSHIRQSVLDEVGVTPDQVLVVPRGTISKTTSGKLRRSALREAYERGELSHTRLSMGRSER